MDQYEAKGYHPSVRNVGEPGHLNVQSTGVGFRWSGGSITFPLNGLKLRKGGHNDSLVFVEHPSLPDWSCCTADMEILDHPVFKGDPQIAAQLRGFKTVTYGRRSFVGCLVIGLVLFVAGLIYIRPKIVDRITKAVPVSIEKDLGDMTFESVIMGQRILSSEALDQNLNELFAPLPAVVTELKYEFRLSVIEDETLNAFAMPGGNIVIHSGAILMAESAEELLGVLAHEMAHVTERHSIRAMVNSLGWFILVQVMLGDSSGLLAIVETAAPYVLEQQFSRGQERDADRVGMQYLVDANIDPSGMIRFFETLQREYADVAELEEGLSFLSSHPTTKERIQSLETRASEYPDQDYRSLEVPFQALKAEVRNLLEEKSQIEKKGTSVKSTSLVYN